MSSQDYAEMIEIPVSSCEIFVTPKTNDKRAKKRLLKRFKRTPFPFRRQKSGETKDTASETGIYKQKEQPDFVYESDGYNDSDAASLSYDEAQAENFAEKGKKRFFKWDIVTAQIVTVFVLAVGILLTNIFWKDSGINNLLKSVFASDTVTADERNYDAFDVFSPSKNEVELSNGVMTLTKSGAVYSPADGKVLSVELNNGKYTVKVLHSDSFITVITGADYIYLAEGDRVFSSTPVCYSKEGGTQVKMYDNDVILTDYSIQDGKIVWQS